MTIVIILLVVVALWGVMQYNALVGLRNNVQNAFRQIDVQLKRRHDLIPNLVNSVKGEMKFEQDTLEKVMKARAAAVSASQAANVADMSKAEGVLGQALGRLLAVVENYPNLKASEAVGKLMEELTHTENQVGFSRQLYNDLVTKFNTKQQVVPTNIIAQIGGFTPAELFEIPQEKAGEREAPAVNLQ